MVIRVNPLQTNGNYSYSCIKISFKKRRDNGEKILWYDYCVYELVDSWKPILGYISKFKGKKVSGSNGLMKLQRFKANQRDWCKKLLKNLLSSRDWRRAKRSFTIKSQCVWNIHDFYHWFSTVSHRFKYSLGSLFIRDCRLNNATFIMVVFYNSSHCFLFLSCLNCVSKIFKNK